MEGKSFAKLARDCHLIDKRLTAADVDLAFAKCKIHKNERKIGFKEFVHGLEILAEKKGITYDELE
jgi:hypothetical protein